MTSQLASQLQKLQQRRVDDKRLADSFLFSKSDAKSFSREQVHELAVAGLQVLIATDNRFHSFLESLFDPRRIRQERKLLTTEQNHELDLLLDQFLTFLSPHLLLTPAQQAFEYLVRVHEVHVYNVSSVLRAFLPYHDHNLFARAILLVDFRGTGFEFLETNQERAAPLLREHLILACGESRKVLRLVCLSVAMSTRLKVHHPAANALFASVATALAVHRDAESMWRVLVPFVLEFLSGKVSGSEVGAAESQHAAGESETTILFGSAPRHGGDLEVLSTSLLVLAAWSSEVTFTVPMLSTMLKPVIHYMGESIGAHSALPLSVLLSVVEVLFQTQTVAVSEVSFTPQLAALLALPWDTSAILTALAPDFEEAEARRVCPFEATFQALVRHCLERLHAAQSFASVPAEVLRFLRTAAGELPLSERAVSHFLRALVAVDGELAEDTSARSFLQLSMSALERRYQRVFDATLAKLLEAPPAGTSEDHVARFLHRHLGGARYELLDIGKVAGHHGPPRLPLFACLLHSLPPVRSLAAKALSSMKLTELEASTGSSTSGMGGSLLELLAHVSQYEADETVARALVGASGAALKHLIEALTSSTATTPSEEGKHRYYYGAVQGLLRALLILASIHGNAMRQSIFATALQPNLARMGGKNAARGTSPALQSMLLYHTTQLYLSLVDEAEGGAAAAVEASLRQAVTAGLTTTEEGLFASPLPSPLAKHKKKAQESSDEDDEESTSRRATTSQRGPSHVDVFSSSALLLAMAEEASARLPGCVEDLHKQLHSRHPLPTAQAHAAALEFALAAASSLRHNGETTAPLLLRFLLGSGNGSSNQGSESNGYLVALQQEQRTTARLAQSSEVAQRVGRGVTNSLLSDSYLPSNEATKMLAVVVQRVVAQLLCAADSDTSASTATVTCLMELLAYLGAPLPALASAPATLAPSFFALLEQHGGARRAEEDQELFPIPWQELIHNATYSAEVSSTGTGAANLSAVALTLLLPLRTTPGRPREATLQNLQDAILRGSSKSSTKPATSAMIVLSAAMEGPQSVSPTKKKSATPASTAATISVTTLSTIVEAMAKEESRLTATAAELVCSMLAEMLEGGSCMASLPFSLAREVVEHFFPAPSTTRTRKSVEGQAGVALNRLLPTVERLVTAAGAIESVRRHRGEALVSLSQAAADFVEAVCRRMTPAAVTDAEAPVVALCLHLLRYPFLRVEGSSSRGVYRHALTSLAVVLQQGLEGEQSSSVIIQASPRAKKGAKAGDAGELEGFFAKLATTVTPAVWAAVRNIGVDVAQLCVGTTGGFTRLFLPLLEVLTHPTKTTTVEARQEHLEVMNELLESLVPQEVRSVEEDSESPVAPVRWQAPANCATTSPLRYEHAAALLKIPQVLCKGAAASFCWSNTLCPRQCLRLLATILRLSPTIHFDDDESEESLAALVEAMLATYPLDAFQTLLHQGATHSSGRLEVMGNGSNRVVDAITRQVLLLAQQFVSLCLHQPRALCEHDAKAASRIASTVIKQGLVLMAGLLLRSHQDNEEEEQALSAEETANITRQKVDTVAELLRALAPLLTPQSSVVTSSSSTSSGRVVLHIPLLALLIRLESVERSEALGFRTAAEVCQSILSSFDAPTQMACISQLMRLVTDPHGQLASLGEGKDTDSDELAQLLRRMVKPNQIINRQEEVLNLICTTVKADSFLRPFIELQHRTNRHAPGSEDTTAAAREEEVKGVDGNDACMDLLVCSLELFAHFSELNAQTPNEATSSANKMASEEDAPIFGEGKAYTMVLELVAGNTLACVLSGINEPTFVKCLKKLLMDSRTALQLKGLEVLLDRLHHSLPTVENTLSDEEVEQHRRDLRDPKKRITLNDLIRIKARPLTTKRSIGLWEHLEALLGASIDGTTAFIDDAKPSGEDRTKVAISMPLEAFEQVARISHLSVACMEELARIVASGGSTQAEKTLLNIHRGKRVTEPLLAKLFGNKARVEAVHKLVEKACDEIMPQLTKALLQAQTVRSSGSSTNAATNSPAKKKASRAKAAELLDASFEHFSRCVEEQVMGTMTLVLTALGTVVQAMGAAFTAPHSTKLLHTIVSACMHHVVELPTVIARGEVGGVLRFSALSSLIRCFPSCWQMSHPYLSPIIFAATHRINVDDAESHALSSELLTVLEALMEPQVFLDAAIICLRGLQHYSGALYSIEELQKRVDAEEAESGKSDKRRAVHGRVLRLQVESHSFPLFFQCIQRRVQNLSKDELSHMRSMSDEGASVATAQNNFWVASMQALASSPTVPPSEVVVPVLEAFTTFFLKFKAKHCVRIVRYMANWAFGGNSEHFSKYLNQNLGEGEEDEDDATGERSHAQAVSRRTVHAWLLFFALLNHLLEKLGSIMEFGFSEVLPYVVVTLSNYCSSSARSPAKALAPLIALTLEGALEAVRRMSASQLPPPDYDYSIPLEVFFATAEVFNGIMPALVHQLTNTAYLTDDVHPYSFRAQQSVIPAVSTFFSCLNSSKLQGKMQAELVRALRHPNKHVRRMTLLCLDAIYAEGGEELASRLMAEMLPTVVELTEDKDDVVVENARQLCTHLSHMTGQDVLHALR